MVSEFLKRHVILQPLSAESINAPIPQRHMDMYLNEQQIRISLIEQMEASDAR